MSPFEPDPRYIGAGRRPILTASITILMGLLAAIGGGGSSALAANQVDPPIPPLPAATYQQESQDVAIPMDDGVSLGATVTFPSNDGTNPAPGHFPVILSMTPYGRHGVCGCPSPAVYATRGVISAVVDVRGTGGSGGNLDGNYFSPREQRDGYELVEYFGTQPYSSGKVGMQGGSYLGITQYLTAEQQPPHLAAIAPAVALADLYRDAYTHGGIFNLFFDTQYIAVQGGPGAIGIDGQSQVPFTLGAKADQAQGTPIAFDYLARPNDDQFYRDRSPIYHADRIKVPTLILDGWRNGFIRGDIEMYQALAKRPGVETRLYVDPCTHKGCGAPFAPTISATGLDDVTALQFEFMSHYLLGTPEAERSRVRIYVQAASHYDNVGAWPPPATQYLRFYLSQAALTPVAPVTAGSPNYVTNPTAGASMSFDMYGTIAGSPYVPTDQRLEDLQGLTWRTPPLGSAALLTGPSQLHLVASTTGTDTDWVAKLADVAPDGNEAIISEGYLRASHRQLDHARSTPASPYHTHVNPTAVQPGKLYDYEVGIWPTAYQVAAGHRLQLRLTTDDIPTHWPGTLQFNQADPAATQATPFPPATNTVNEGGLDPSFLVLPVSGAAGLSFAPPSAPDSATKGGLPLTSVGGSTTAGWWLLALPAFATAGTLLRKRVSRRQLRG